MGLGLLLEPLCSQLSEFHLESTEDGQGQPGDGLGELNWLDAVPAVLFVERTTSVLQFFEFPFLGSPHGHLGRAEDPGYWLQPLPRQCKHLPVPLQPSEHAGLSRLSTRLLGSCYGLLPTWQAAALEVPGLFEGRGLAERKRCLEALEALAAHARWS